MTLEATDASDPSSSGRTADGAAFDASDLLPVFAALPLNGVLLAPDEPRFTILAATDAYCRASRTPRAAMLGRGLFDVFGDTVIGECGAGGTPERHAEAGLRRSFAEVLRTGRPHQPPAQRFDVVESDGRSGVRYWQPLNTPVLGPDGGVRYLLHQVEDVTDAVVQRQAALTAEHRATRLLERMADAYIVLDGEFRVIDANQAAERVLGVAKEMFLGKTHWEAWPASAASDVERHYRRVITDGVDVRFTHHYVGEGYDLHLEVDAYPTDAGGVAIFWRDVTDRVRAEAALRESEERYRTLAELSPDATWVNQDGRFVYANPAAARLVGASSPDDVIGRSPFEVADPEYHPLIRERVRQLLERQGTAAPMEMRWRRIDGSAVEVETAAGVITWQGRPAVQVVCRDITERKRAEAALRASEAKYRTLFESMDEGFCVIEVLFDGDRAVDYRFLEANPAFEQQTGLVGAVGHTAREVVPGLETHWIETYGRVAATGEPTRFQSGSDAMKRWFDVFAFRAGPPEDRRVAILFTDVSAAKTAEAERARLVAELSAERERLRAVILHMPAPLALLVGPEHRHELVNAAFRRISGGGRDVTGLTVREAFPELAGQGIFEQFDRVYATGEPWIAPEMPVRFDRDGAGVQETWFDVRFEPVRDTAERVVAILNFGVDVTEQVRARREVERLLGESERARAEAEAARAEAEAANRAKGEFLAVMSHELRTPLNAIGGYAELLEMGIRGPITAQQVEDLRRIQASQRHLLGLVNEVLNYARIETGTVRYDIADIPLAAVVASVEPLVAPQLAAKGLAFATASCDPAPVARADREKVRQVLLNLLSNAVKFTDAPGRVEVACEVAGDRVRVCVRDTGIGIAPEELERVFEPFVQVNASLTRTHEGTGLGLAISRDLARGMGGDLTAESAPGAGSTFTLTLPRA